MTDTTIREPDQIRQDCARKLRPMQISDHFRAILGCLLGEDWNVNGSCATFPLPHTPSLIACGATPRKTATCT